MRQFLNRPTHYTLTHPYLFTNKILYALAYIFTNTRICPCYVARERSTNHVIGKIYTGGELRGELALDRIRNGMVSEPDEQLQVIGQ